MHVKGKLLCYTVGAPEATQNCGANKTQFVL